MSTDLSAFFDDMVVVQEKEQKKYEKGKVFHPHFVYALFSFNKSAPESMMNNGTPILDRLSIISPRKKDAWQSRSSKARPKNILLLEEKNENVR